MNREELEQRLLRFIRQRSSSGPEAELTLDTDLREAGHIDSMRFIALMALLEELGAENIDDVISNPDHFRSVRSLVECCF